MLHVVTENNFYINYIYSPLGEQQSITATSFKTGTLRPAGVSWIETTTVSTLAISISNGPTSHQSFAPRPAGREICKS